jgi:hypothetical protein
VKLVVGGRYTWANWTLVSDEYDIVYLYNGYAGISNDGNQWLVDVVMDGRGRRLFYNGRTETIPAYVMADIRATYRPDAAPTTPGQPIMTRPGGTILEVGWLQFRSSKAGKQAVVCYVSTCEVYNECTYTQDCMHANPYILNGYNMYRK